MKRNKFSIFIPGQTMIEVVIAVGIVVVLSVALITTSLVTQKTARSARNTTQATKLAQEYIEQIRVFRDRRGFESVPTGDCYKIISPSDIELWEVKDCLNFGIDEVTLDTTKFTRSLDIESIVANKKLKITVTVMWEESGGTQVIEHTTFITQWEQ